MGANLMYSPLETVFASTMEREGRTVTAYTSGAEFQAFMRRNDDGNNFEDRITLYYATNSPVVQGSLVSYGNKIYLLVNRETEENDCYYKSSGLACNGMITLNDGTIVGIPTYAYNMNGSLIDENEVISVIDGNMEFLTESNSLSRQLAIGRTFNEFGRTFKINNIYYKDGILHLVTEVSYDETPTESNTLVIDGLTSESYDVGATVQLSVTPYTNGAITTGTFTYESTNTSVATIDGNGLVTFVGNGSVAFKVYWVEKDIQNITNTVAVGSTEAYVASITGNKKLVVDYNRTYTAVLKDGDGNTLEGTWEWSYDFKYPEAVSTTITNEKIVFFVDSEINDDVYGETMDITAHETTHNVSATITVTVDALW